MDQWADSGVRTRQFPVFMHGHFLSILTTKKVISRGLNLSCLMPSPTCQLTAPNWLKNKFHAKKKRHHQLLSTKMDGVSRGWRELCYKQHKLAGHVILEAKSFPFPVSFRSRGEIKGLGSFPDNVKLRAFLKAWKRGKFHSVQLQPNDPDKRLPPISWKER